MERERRRRTARTETQETIDLPSSPQTIQEPMNQTTQGVSQAPQTALFEEETIPTQRALFETTVSTKKTSGIKSFLVFVAFVLSIGLSGYLYYQNNCLTDQNNNLTSQVNILLSEQNKLLNEIDELKFGKERLEVRIAGSFRNKSYDDAKEAIALYTEKYPDSEKNTEYFAMLDAIRDIEMKEIIDDYDSRISDARQKKDFSTAISLINGFLSQYPSSEKSVEYRQLLITVSDEKEQARIEANRNNTGMWTVTYYVDSFGIATSEPYIQNRNYISGKFNNSATQGSDLNVRFLIDSNSQIAIKLYEYAGNNPVKEYSKTPYYGYIMDGDGKRTSISGYNSSDRIKLDAESSSAVHNALIKGGCVRFYIKESEYGMSEYSFSINNTEWYANAYRILMEKKKNK